MNREGELGTDKNKELIKGLLESGKHIGSDLSGHQLFNLNLSEKDFSKSSFKGANLSGTNLSFSNLSSTDLTDANLEGAHLFSCNLTGAKRSGKQIMKYASFSIEDKYYYAFLCKGQRGLVVLINEPNKPEYEYKQASATQVGASFYNFLVNTG